MRLLAVLFIAFFGFSNELFAQNKIELEEMNTGKYILDNQGNSSDFIVLQFMNKEQIHQLKNAISLGNNWVAMRRSDIDAQRILEKFKLIQYGQLKSSSKFSELFKIDFDINKKYISQEQLKFQIHTWGTREELESILKAKGIELLQWNSDLHFGVIECNKSKIEEIVEANQIAFIEPISEQRTPLQNNAGALNNYSRVHSVAPLGFGIGGSGINIGVWDYGLAGFHRDLTGQYTNVEKNFYGNGASQHATLVLGAIASKGVMRADYIGAAPQSKVFMYDFFGSVLDEVKSAKDNFQVYATNHSYNLGDNYRCFTDYAYSTASQEIDQFAINEPQIVNVFAAGNSATACAYDYKTIVPGFQYGKNVLLVGNLQRNETFYPGSAKGPTNDGRLRPDVMAQGSGSFTPTTGIMLQTPTDAYTHAYGTSFASPIVTGIVGLMQEAYLNKYGELPWNATVKAILCNTAKDLGRSGPDYEYGFGKVDAYEAIKSIENEQFIIDSVEYLQTKNFDINIPSGVLQAKFFITWNDLPASLPNTKVLVNDIDLQVLNGSKTHLPLILNPSKPLLYAQEGIDTLNNSEQIVIDHPEAGNYQIKVEGKDILSDNQSFAISYWFNTSELTWNFPFQNQIIPANTVNIIRWRSSVSDSIKIDYSVDNGATWLKIGIQSADSSEYGWLTPDAYYSKVILRASTIDDRVISVSDTFSISPRITISSNKICYDHIRLNWASIPSAEKYFVYLLNAQNIWENIGETSENLFYFSKTQEGHDYIFAVSPIINGEEGLRSYALKLTAKNQATCAFTYKDIGVSSILPISGTFGEEHSLSDTQRVSFKIINYGNSVVNDAWLYYQVDTNVIQQVSLGNIAANAVINKESEATYDFSVVGDYIVRAWVQGVGDSLSHNDTLVQVISQKNPVVASFPYLQDFESINDEALYVQSTSNLDNIPEWDYVKSGAGRILNFHSSSYSPNGNRSLSADAFIDNSEVNNTLYLHIDLSSQKDSLVYLDFNIVQRDATGGDSIFIKTHSSADWIPIKSIFNPNRTKGEIYFDKRINISEIVAQSGAELSDHCDLKFVMNSNRITTTIGANGGYTLDDIHLYNGGEDISLQKINIPTANCVYQNTLPIQIPVKILIKNNSPNLILANAIHAQIFIGDSLVLSENIPFEMQGFEEKEYEFSQYLSFDDYESYLISAKIDYAQDVIVDNNEISDYAINFLKAIKQLPIEFSFDQPDELPFVPSGISYSWELGRPTKGYLYNVADNPGNAWVTRLNDLYLTDEYSFLYVGCFDPSMLTYASEISFLSVLNTELGADAAWMEYSYNGEDWQKMGTNQSGYNWYNKDNQYQIWDGNQLNWQVRSFPLTGFVDTDSNSLFIRFVFGSNEYIEMEGIGIDNLRINNELHARIAPETLTATGNSIGAGWVELKNNDVIYAYLNDRGQNLGQISLAIQVADSLVPVYRDKFLLSRYFNIHTENKATSDFDLKLFVKNEEYLTDLSRDLNIRRMGELGYLVYDGLNVDSSFDNNHFDENYQFYHPDSIEFWPYLDGYEIRLSLSQSDAEIYLTSNQFSPSAYPFVAITGLNVFRTDSSNHTFVQWTASKEDSLERYVVQYSDNGLDFADIGIVLPRSDKNYLFIDSLHNITGAHYYRIRAEQTAKSYTSLIDSLSFEYNSTGIVNNAQSSPVISVYYQGGGVLDISTLGEPVHLKKIRLLDISGRVISEIKDFSLVNHQKVHFEPLEKLASGVYILQLMINNERISHKFVKSE
ncbi:MAG: S8 family serine peptidase [Chitinophagales bacterium]|nr:S8 family serine peptidase [Chitinophagales bacterium]